MDAAARQRELVERIQGAGELDAVHEFIAEDFVDHTPFPGLDKGELLGVPPTGRRVTIRVMDFVRHRDGQVVEHWNIVDVAGLMAQLGADA